MDIIDLEIDPEINLEIDMTLDLVTRREGDLLTITISVVRCPSMTNVVKDSLVERCSTSVRTTDMCNRRSGHNSSVEMDPLETANINKVGKIILLNFAMGAASPTM